MDVSIKTTRKQIEGYNERIAEETRRLEINTQAKREETSRKLQEAKDNVTTAEASLAAINSEMRQKKEELDTVGKEGQETENVMKAAKAHVEACQNMLTRTREQEQNSLAPYGKDIKGVQAQIAKMRWQGQAPIGPLGVHVKVKDPKKWAQLLRGQLGQYMMAFACTDARDRNQLKKLLKDSGK